MDKSESTGIFRRMFFSFGISVTDVADQRKKRSKNFADASESMNFRNNRTGVDSTYNL